MLISAENIYKSYVEKVLFKDVSIYINEGDKIGIIGVNGTGKSTLMKIIAQVEPADSGSITTKAGIKIDYLSQDPELNDESTVLEQVLSGTSSKTMEIKTYEAKTILTKLGIDDFDASISNLSGGQRKRVAIASALVHNSDVLILDEPTNHLDNDMVEWLEKYLNKYNGAILMVTHDRYFLDRVTNKIVEIDKGNLYTYPGNYSKYLQMKEEKEAIELGTRRKKKSLLKKELEWIRQGAKGRGTKSKVRIEHYEKLREETRYSQDDKLEMESITTRLGKKVVDIHKITKGYGENILIKDFEYLIAPGERIGIIGENGSGKTTLLNMINGTIEPDNGSIEIGQTVKIGYFSQTCQEMDPKQRVIDYIKDIAEFVNTPEGLVSASKMLERFLFSPDIQWSVIGKLSGGEKRRLYLLGILIGSPNVLLLDEPTNDLDIETLTILEDYLESFKGTVITVSHDRYFLDKVVDVLLDFKGDGRIDKYHGSYSDYLIEKREEEGAVKEPSYKGSQDKREKDKVKTKLSFNEQREFENIEGDISRLEGELENLEKDISLQTSDYVKLQELMDKKSFIEGQLEEKMERWVYLNDLNEEIEKRKNR